MLNSSRDGSLHCERVAGLHILVPISHQSVASSIRKFAAIAFERVCDYASRVDEIPEEYECRNYQEDGVPFQTMRRLANR